MQQLARFLVRYFGVLSSHSKFRSEVVPKPPQDSAVFEPPPASGDQLEFPKLNGGPMRWLEAATTEQAATALLAKLGLDSSTSPDATTGFVRATEVWVLLRV